MFNGKEEWMKNNKNKKIKSLSWTCQIGIDSKIHYVICILPASCREIHEFQRKLTICPDLKVFAWLAIWLISWYHGKY